MEMNEQKVREAAQRTASRESTFGISVLIGLTDLLSSGSFFCWAAYQLA